MSRYTEITVGGEIIRKHHRDVDKDRVVCSMLPEGTLRIFEASAGKAVLARELRDAGHEVTISNYNLQDIPGLEEHRVDLNGTIPLEDDRFDVVLCKEVIEHVESVPHTLREFGRILRPGGTLILTFPNRLHIRSRFFHLFTGFYRGLKSPINLDVAFGEGHINLIGYPEMDYFLRKMGYEPQRVDASHYQAGDAVLLALRPLIGLTTRHYLLRHKKNAQEHEKTQPENIAYNTFMAQTLTGKPLFIGKDVIIAAQKTQP